MVDKPNTESMNTTEILLFLNKTLFSKEPNKLSNNNQLLRLYTFLDSRAATELGSKIRALPNIARIQEKAETVINKFRADKSEGAVKAFNMFVDEIQEPSTRSAKYTKGFNELQKSFKDFISELATGMETLLPKSLSDNKIKPYLDELKKYDRYKDLASTTTSLERDGERLRAEFEKLDQKAKITLAAVSPQIAMQDKNKAAAAPKTDGPTNPAND